MKLEKRSNVAKVFAFLCSKKQSKGHCPDLSFYTIEKGFLKKKEKEKGFLVPLSYSKDRRAFTKGYWHTRDTQNDFLCLLKH